MPATTNFISRKVNELYSATAYTITFHTGTIDVATVTTAELDLQQVGSITANRILIGGEPYEIQFTGTTNATFNDVTALAIKDSDTGNHIHVYPIVGDAVTFLSQSEVLLLVSLVR